jgi:hypothetical protein
MRRWLTLAGAIVVLALAGCSSQNCTAAGCFSGAQVDMTALPLQPGPMAEVRVCVDQTCSRRSPETQPLVGAEVDAPYTGESEVTVTIRVIAPNGAVLANTSIRSRLERLQPNGPKCSPVCFITRLKLAASGRLEQA